MRSEKWIYAFIGVIIGLIAGWVIGTNITTVDNPAGMMGDKASTMQSQNIDTHFIEQMIPHHGDAITMARLAQTKAQRPEVKQLAQNIIDSQGKEINQMKSWYKDWFGRELPTGTEVMQHHGMGSSSGMHMGMRGDESDLTRLDQAGDFDTAFVEHMIPHHQMAVMMASMLKNSTERSEMRLLADDIITAQTNEIDQMRKWLKEWE